MRVTRIERRDTDVRISKREFIGGTYENQGAGGLSPACRCVL